MLDVTSILDQVVSHAEASGWFTAVNGHEPKHAPGKGLHAAVWIQSIGPAAGASGLQATTGQLVVNVRVYSDMLQEPQDAIDPNVLRATAALMGAYSSDFELGDRVRNVDLLGSAGAALSAQAGYLAIGSTMYRVMTITLPLLVNDIWEQVA